MKKLQQVKGMRDCNILEVSLHIANLTYQYRQDRKIFSDERLSHEARQEAYQRMCKTRELVEAWKEVRNDILKKEKIVI